MSKQGHYRLKRVVAVINEMRGVRAQVIFEEEGETTFKIMEWED